MTTRMCLEDILLSEISQRKTNATRSHLYVESKKKQTLIETGEWWLPGTRLGEMGQAVNGTSFQ